MSEAANLPVRAFVDATENYVPSEPVVLPVDFELRYARVRKLAVENRRANEAVSAAFATQTPEPDYGTEAYIRREVVRDMVIRTKLAAEVAYHNACNDFFLNSAEFAS